MHRQLAWLLRQCHTRCPLMAAPPNDPSPSPAMHSRRQIMSLGISKWQQAAAKRQLAAATGNFSPARNVICRKQINFQAFSKNRFVDEYLGWLNWQASLAIQSHKKQGSHPVILKEYSAIHYIFLVKYIYSSN